MEHEQRIPALAEGCEPIRLSLTPAEGFLLSRIDGHTPWTVLREIGGLTPNEVDTCLEQWLCEGIVVCSGAREPAVPAEPVDPAVERELDGSYEDRAGPESTEAGFEGELAPNLDISVDAQREILVFEAGLNRSYWETLGVALDADEREIKRAYFKLSRKFHPDRYYRRNIGDFGPRLDRIFKRLVEACELLSDPTTRAELQRSMGQLPPPDAPPGSDAAGEEGNAETAAKSADREHASSSETPGASDSTGAAITKRQRQQKVLDRLRRHFQIPERVLIDRRFQASQFYKSAMVALHRKSVIEAESSVRLAIAFDPWNPEYKQGFSEVLAQAHQLRAEALLERASLDGASQAEALRLYEEALHYRPCDPEIHDKAARLAVELRELDKAREYAESACEVDPGESRYHCTLGRVLRSAGLVDKAREALDEALRLDPQNQEVRSELAQLRRGNRRR